MILVFLALLGLIPAFIARDKGRDFATWWVFGAFLFLPALIWAMCLYPNSFTREIGKPPPYKGPMLPPKLK